MAQVATPQSKEADKASQIQTGVQLGGGGGHFVRTGQDFLSSGTYVRPVEQHGVDVPQMHGSL